MSTEVVGIVLAGGKSRRFNVGDEPYIHKGLASVNGRALIIHVLESLQSACSKFLVIVNSEGVKRDFKRVITDFSHELSQKEVTVIVDEPLRVHGPLRGLLTGLNHVKEGFVITSACDTLVPPLLVKQMAEVLRHDQVDVVAIQNVRQKLEPTIVGINLSSSFRLKLLQLGLMPRGRLADVVRMASSVGFITPLRDVIVNINTRDEWRLAEIQGFPRELTRDEIRVTVVKGMTSTHFEQYVKAVITGDHAVAVHHLKNELQQLKESHLSSLAAHAAKDLLKMAKTRKQELEKN